MTGRRTYTIGILALAAIVAGSACSSDTPVGVDELAIVTDVTPTANATGVGIGTPIGMSFNHAMGMGMEAYVALHVGGLTGPTVPGTWGWSPDRRHLEFHPDAPLLHRTRYTLHLGGAVTDEHGHGFDYDHCIAQHGGEWFWGQMMGGQQLGSGWMHGNGSYGVSFSFETE